MTLVELLVSMAIALMVFALVGMVFLDMKKYMLRQEIQAAMIQNARIGLDEMARLIRMAGYHCDAENGQVTLIEAAPFQLTFNADTDPDHDVFPPKAMLPLYDNPNDYVSPDAQFTTGAETIRFTLDSTDDGDVDKRDIGDDTSGERDSPNPDDMSLIKEINGKNDRQITLGMLGPINQAGERTGLTPMFQYWAALSPCAEILLGDLDCNGALEGDERYFRPITSPEILNAIRRVRISVTVGGDRKDPFDTSKYPDMLLSTEVNLRNPHKEAFFDPDPIEYAGCSFRTTECGCLP